MAVEIQTTVRFYDENGPKYPIRTQKKSSAQVKAFQKKVYDAFVIALSHTDISAETDLQYSGMMFDLCAYDAKIGTVVVKDGERFIVSEEDEIGGWSGSIIESVVQIMK